MICPALAAEAPEGTAPVRPEGQDASKAVLGSDFPRGGELGHDLVHVLGAAVQGDGLGVLPDGGRTLTLADVQWLEAGEFYNATASYTGTATSKYATGSRKASPAAPAPMGRTSSHFRPIPPEVPGSVCSGGGVSILSLLPSSGPGSFWLWL